VTLLRDQTPANVILTIAFLVPCGDSNFRSRMADVPPMPTNQTLTSNQGCKLDNLEKAHLFSADIANQPLAHIALLPPLPIRTLAAHLRSVRAQATLVKMSVSLNWQPRLTS
jgi:hypothetical protein